METIVKNLITNEETIFVNSLSLTENIVSTIILESKRTGQLINEDYRNEIKKQFPIVEAKSTITGRQFAYCESKHLHAKFN
jgi:hypothetical protein